jgi:hypothetical protein
MLLEFGPLLLVVRTSCANVAPVPIRPRGRRWTPPVVEPLKPWIGRTFSGGNWKPSPTPEPTEALERVALNWTLKLQGPWQLLHHSRASQVASTPVSCRTSQHFISDVAGLAPLPVTTHCYPSGMAAAAASTSPYGAAQRHNRSYCARALASHWCHLVGARTGSTVTRLD